MTSFSWPVNGPVSSNFGDRGSSHHDGIDIAVPNGTPVHAAAAGTVLSVQPTALSGGYGNLVILVHPDGWSTYYAHLDRASVIPGQSVAAGAVVGLSNNTGRSTGPHVHFETRHNGTPTNPRPLLDGTSTADLGTSDTTSGGLVPVVDIPNPFSIPGELVERVTALWNVFSAGARFAALLANPATWLRVLGVVVGSTVVVVGIAVMARDWIADGFETAADVAPLVAVAA
jgi:murein DD-endopeptidase MepM/ murein hydrolase activator NlpD